MSNLKTPLILGLGHKAQQGKDTAAAFMIEERSYLFNIESIPFAHALRQEVNEACEDLIHTGVVATHVEALRVLCHVWNVPFIEDAPVDVLYPHGKQRYLLQAIGQGRRDEDPNHWIKLWSVAVAKSRADVILVTDMRYPNEANIIESKGGYTAKFSRLDYEGLSAKAATHISENALNGYAFHFYITARDGQLPWLRRQALNLFDFITQRGTL